MGGKIPVRVMIRCDVMEIFQNSFLERISLKELCCGGSPKGRSRTSSWSIIFTIESSLACRDCFDDNKQLCSALVGTMVLIGINLLVQQTTSRQEDRDVSTNTFRVKRDQLPEIKNLVVSKNYANYYQISIGFKTLCSKNQSEVCSSLRINISMTIYPID